MKLHLLCSHYAPGMSTHDEQTVRCLRSAVARLAAETQLVVVAGRRYWASSWQVTT